MQHSEKVVDGIVLKYLCQPCPECRAKLEAAEWMAILLKSLAAVMSIERQIAKQKAWDAPIEEIKAVLSAWENAGKGGQL